MLRSGSVLLLVLLTSWPPGLSLEDFARDPRLVRLIPDFGRHFYIHEAVLFPPSESGSQEELQSLVHVQKLLSAAGFPSTIARNLSEFRNLHQRWPLCVVFFDRGTSVATPAWFKEAFARGRVSRSCKWLLLEPPSLSQVPLPVDSEVFVARFSQRDVEDSVQVVVSEVYRVVQPDHYDKEVLRDVHYKETEVVTWRPDAGISATTRRSLTQRRSDLSGVVVRFLVVEDRPWAYTARDSADVITFHGFVPDVARALSGCTNITFGMEAHWDRQYGVSLPSGRWTGMIGEIVSSAALAVGGPLSMTVDRLGGVDFTYPLYNNKDVLVVRRPSNAEDTDSWRRLVSPLRPAVWLCVLPCVLASGLTLHLVSGSPRLSDALLKAAGVVCGQAAPKCEGPRRPAASRLLVLSLHFSAICLLACYTGQLTAYLGIRHVRLPFHGMEGLLSSDTRHLGLLHGSSSHDYFAKGVDFVSREIYVKLVSGQHMPTSDEEGLRRACQDRSYAFIVDQESLTVLERDLHCQLMEIPDVFLDNKICLGTSRDFPYKRIFNYW